VARRRVVNNATTLFTYMLSLATSLITFLVLISDANAEPGYRILWLLPFSFVVVMTLTTSITERVSKSLTLTIAFGGYFVRFVLTPLFLALGDYRFIFSRLVTSSEVEKAIILMVYELFVVFLLVELFVRVTWRKPPRDKGMVNANTLLDDSSKNIHALLFVLSIFCLAIVVYVPEIVESYTWIFGQTEEIANVRYNIDEIAIRGTLKRALSSLFIFVFNLVRYLLPVYMLRIVYRRRSSSGFAYWVSFLICLSPFLVINESNIQPFFGLMINVIMMNKLYPERKKATLCLFLLGGGFLVAAVAFAKLVLLAKWQGTSGTASLALTLNAYFPGVGNVAAAYNVSRSFLLGTFLSDLFSTIPFRNTLFPSFALQARTLTQLYNIANGTLGNIIPCISGAEYYVGPILAPLVPAFVLCMAVRMEVKGQTSRRYWEVFYYHFLAIRMAMIPSIYNHMSIIHMAINQFLPLLLIISLGRRYGHNKSR
jgi:hypothetical protein